MFYNLRKCTQQTPDYAPKCKKPEQHEEQSNIPYFVVYVKITLHFTYSELQCILLQNISSELSYFHSFCQLFCVIYILIFKFLFLLLILSFCEIIIHTKDGINYTQPLKKNHKMNTCAHTDKPKKENTKWSLRSAVCLDHNSFSHPRVILNFAIHCFALQLYPNYITF